jgi:hypothetical protein
MRLDIQVIGSHHHKRLGRTVGTELAPIETGPNALIFAAKDQSPRLGKWRSEMDEDLMARMGAAIKKLHERALVLGHPSKDHDMADVLQALALIMEAQIDLARGQRVLLTGTC